MNKKIELLAPAGGVDSLRAAVENGADAVYLGGKLFNARQNAGNFDMQELQDALYYAHVRGVSIYLAMNTLISDNEVEQAVDFAGDARLMGIDGIIVQDIGFAGLLSRAIPGIPLHASTQMTIYNTEGIRVLERMGFKRAVLARELSLNEIRHITSGTTMEIEIFIHGALCICYSGQCLMSSIIGGRSGNRGCCAQPCRLPYRLIGEGMKDPENRDKIPQYLLSPKDLCSLQYLGDIVTSGVTSLKIEGRMKSPEYVATVVRIYRKYLDMALESNENRSKKMMPLDECDLHDLEQIFNRGGFSGGYLHGKTGKDMMCFEKPKNWGVYLGVVISYDNFERTLKIKLDDKLSIGDGIEVWNKEEESPGTIVTEIKKNGINIKSADKEDIVVIGSINGNIFKDCRVYKTSDKALITSARESFTGKPLKRITLKGSAVLKTGQPLTLKVFDSDGNVSCAESTILPEQAVNRPLTSVRIVEQLGKTGQTPFEFSDIELELDDNLSLPVSEINDVRRRALEEMEQMRASRYGVRCRGEVCHGDGSTDTLKCVSRTVPVTHPKISLYFYNWDSSYDYAAFRADRLYLPLKSLFDARCNEIFDFCRRRGIEIYIWLPAVTRENYENLIKTKIANKSAPEIDGILAGNPGTVEMLKSLEGLRISGDHTLNIFNSLSLDEAAIMGLDGVTLSTELTLGQISKMKYKSEVDIETAVYGRLPLMTSEYCPAGSVYGGSCSKTKCNAGCKTTEFKLKDRMGMEFPVICDTIDCTSTILNSNVLFVPDAIKKLKDSGVSIFRLYIWNEKPQMIKDLVDLHRNMTDNECSSKLGNEDLANHIKSGGFTKGHYYRGV